LRPRAKELRSLCPQEKRKAGIVVFKIGDGKLPDILVHKGEKGYYVVSDEFCTCPSFLRNLDSYRLEPCKHVCAEKRHTRATTLEVDEDEFDTLVLSLLFHEQGVTLNLLLARLTGDGNGEEEKEEEDHNAEA